MLTSNGDFINIFETKMPIVETRGLGGFFGTFEDPGVGKYFIYVLCFTKEKIAIACSVGVEFL